MNIIEVTTEVKVYDSPSELPANEQALLKEAAAAVPRAYAPYSNFFVGAAILTESGKIVSGSNFENASFPVGLCAERIALANKFANLPDERITAIAVSVTNEKAASPVSPCGMCRQALLEAENRQQAPIKILMKGPSEETYSVNSVGQLLPLAFRFERK